MKQKKSKSARPEELPIEIVAKKNKVQNNGTATDLPIEIMAQQGGNQNSSVEVETVKFPMIKAMLEKLDKFLSRRVASIALFYFFAMIVCGSALIANGVVTGATAGGNTGAGNALNIWLYSVIATISFVFILILIRLLMVHAMKKKK